MRWVSVIFALPTIAVFGWFLVRCQRHIEEKREIAASPTAHFVVLGSRVEGKDDSLTYWLQVRPPESRAKVTTVHVSEETYRGVKAGSSIDLHIGPDGRPHTLQITDPSAERATIIAIAVSTTITVGIFAYFILKRRFSATTGAAGGTD
jgi:hypothetical protein